jgi:PAS domain S-box-containing protein
MLAQPISAKTPASDLREAKRLQALRAYPILDTQPERCFDELTELAAQTCGVPYCTLTLLDEKRQWFKSVHGLDLTETPRATGFSHDTAQGRELFEVPDAQRDARFAGSPWVTEPPHIRFYAGVPLITGEGHALGTLAVLDREPRRLTKVQRRGLIILARQAMDQLELRMQRLHLQREEERLQSQLAMERRHLHDALRLAGVGSWRRCLVEGHLTWTEEVFRIFGFRPGEKNPTFDDFLSMVHPDDRETFLWARKRALARREPLDIEHRIIRADGKVRFLHERAEFITNAGGEAIAIAGTVEDVTERTASDAALRESERKYREIVQTSPDLIIALKEEQITFVNMAGMLMLRATFVEQVVGRPVLELLHAQHRAAVEKILEKLREAPASAPPMEVKLLAVDGAELDVEMRALSFPSGDKVALQLHCRDISERLRAQAAMRAGEQRLRQTMDALPLAAYTCDRDGLITYCNERAREVWGRFPRLNHQPERFCGSVRMLRLDGTPLPHEESLMAQTLREEKPLGGTEYIVVRPDGQLRNVVAHTNPFFDPEGALVGAVNVLMDVTERRKTQAALQASEERFTTVAKAATDAIWDWDLQTDLVWWSDGIQSLFGYAPAEIPADGHAWLARIHPNDQARVMESIYNVLESGDDWQEEYYFQRRDGTYAYVLDRGYVIRDAARKPVRMVGGMTDRSERRRIEKELEESEAKFRELAENIDAVFFNFDVHSGKLLYISPGYERIWGRSCQSAYEDPISFLDAVDPKDVASVRAVIQPEPSGSQRDIEFRILGADGEVKWIHAHYSPVINGEGKMERLVGTARDITERKLGRQRILEQAALLDKAHDAIIVRDLEHRVTYWNKSAERIYGWSNQEIQGRSIVTALQMEEVEFLQASCELLANGEWSGELRQRTKQGEELIVGARWTLVSDDQGQPRSVLCIHTDVTERKRMEEHFLRVQRMDSLGTLAGGIAHDLNNVLAPIMMSIDLLKLSCRDSQDMAILSTIEISAKRGSEMVQQVLSFARGVEGRRLVINPAEVVRDVRQMMQETFPKNIDLQVCCQEAVAAFMGDPTQIHQVLINLCVNARDALPQGGRIALRAENTTVDAAYAALYPNAKPGRYVVLSVTDNGSGIPASVQDKIFDPFFTTKELGKGTGLGLSTVLAIVKSHGGFVRFETAVGQGSCFMIHFPAHDSSRQEPTDAADHSHPRGQGETVLVVDDEESVRQITRQTLEAYGYEVLTAGDGAEAIALFAQHARTISAVITDLMMPLMDGPAAIQVMMRMNPKVRIVAVSGLNTSSTAAKLAKLGVKNLLPKPYTAQTLLLVLRQLLDQES